MSNESILEELRNIRAHASLLCQWADAAIKKLEGDKVKKPRKIKGLTIDERAAIRAHLNKWMTKK
jgi:hypothetical protein